VGQERIGWIGLGSIGLPMAQRLVKHGYAVTTCGHQRRAPVEEMRQSGAAEAATPRAVAGAADVVFSMVRDMPQTEEVLFGAQGVWEGLRPGQLLVLSSTLLPDFCLAVAKRGKERGVAVIDAPVSGGPWGAEAGTLTFFVGGDEEDYQRSRPILETMGQNIFYLGGVGTGEVAKISNNLMLWANILAAGEAIRVAQQAGLDRETLLRTVAVSTGGSYVVERWPALIELLGSGDMVKLMYKDVELALKYANNRGLQLPLTGLASQMTLPGLEG